jgi:hypothetical protein
MKNEPRVVRYEPLKQNIRIWFNYLQTALKWNNRWGYRKKKVFNFPINKEYYRAWHLPQVRTLKFDKWYSSHKHLFANKNYVSVRVLDSLSVENAFKEVKKQLIKKVGKTVPFQITNKRFSYVKVDDYLKCFKLRNEKSLDYEAVGGRVFFDYEKKQRLYVQSSNMIKRKFTNKHIDDYKKNDETDTDEVLLQIVRRKVLNAEMIIKNTAKGQFTGKY